IIIGYCLINVISYFTLIETNNYGNTLNNISISLTHSELFLFLIMSVLSYSVFFIYRDIKYYECVQVSTSRIIDVFFAFVLSYNIFVFYILGIGRAGTSTSDIGFLQNILPVFQSTLIYYAVVRKNIRKMQVALLISASIFILLKGWSSHLFIITVAELLYRYRNQRINFTKKLLLVILLPIFIVLFFYVYKLKYYFRSGVMFDIPFFIYFEYVISRLSQISNIAYLYEIRDAFHKIIIENGEGGEFFIKEFLLALIPKSFLGINDYRPLDNLFGINFINSELDNAGFAITVPGLFVISSTFGLLSVLCCFFFILLITKFLYHVFSKNYGSAGAAMAISILLYFNYSGSLKEIALSLFAFFLFKLLSIFQYNFRKIMKIS
ncbi:oligosaccharide repeat unit polymerase, partial [Escherichia coli]|nr:oligosaccharide repeat unit polymerase [Escherichia coli]